MDTSMGVLELPPEAMVKVSVIHVRRTPCRSRSSIMAFCSAVGNSKTRNERSAAIRVRACPKSISRQAWLNPRTPVKEPTPIATASMTNRNLNEEERASRHAILKAVVQEKFMACLPGGILGKHQTVAQSNAAAGAGRQYRIVRHHNPGGSLALVSGNHHATNMPSAPTIQIA